MEITDFGYFTVREPRRGEPSLLYFVNDLGQDWYEMRSALTEWDRYGVFVNAIYGAWAAVDADGIVTNVEYDPSRLMPGDRTVLGINADHTKIHKGMIWDGKELRDGNS